MFELVENVSQQAVIKVIGVGGCGGNAVEHMLASQLSSVSFIKANTDIQALRSRSDKALMLQLGEKQTRGLGAGANPMLGQQVAREDSARISEAIDGADILFITAGMGGGTGTGASPVVAELAREKGILTVAVVTRPFPFERNRQSVATDGIRELHEKVDSLIIIPNEKVLAVMGKDATVEAAFAKANDVLLNAVQGIAELITRPGLINVDFADVRTVMSEMGMAMMGSATAQGESRAVEATRSAISSPLLEDMNLNGAKGMLVNVTASPGLAIGEFDEVGNAIQEYASDQANLVIGTVLDESMGDELRVTLIATGLDNPFAEKIKPVKPMSGGSGESLADAGDISPQAPKVAAEPEPMRAVAGGGAPRQFNLQELDIPPFLRRQAD